MLKSKYRYDSDMADNNDERYLERAAEVRRIAQEAIQNITHLSNSNGNQENTTQSNDPAETLPRPG